MKSPQSAIVLLLILGGAMNGSLCEAWPGIGENN